MKRFLINAGWSFGIAVLAMAILNGFYELYQALLAGNWPSVGGAFFIFMAVWVMSYIVIAQRPRSEQ